MPSVNTVPAAFEAITAEKGFTVENVVPMEPGHEDRAHDHNGVVAQRDEDRRENRVEGHGLLLQAAHGASEDHEHRHAEHEQKLAALGLLREGGKAAFEGAVTFTTPIRPPRHRMNTMTSMPSITPQTME